MSMMTMSLGNRETTVDATDWTGTNRRKFLALAGGAAATMATTGLASADSHGGDENDDDNNDDVADYTGEAVVEIDVGGEDGENIFDPAEIRIDPGTTVIWNWESGSHDLYPDDIPSRSDWEGVDEREEPDYQHMHTFVHPGTYEYVCTPHEDQGMVGSIEVTDDADLVDYTGEDEVEIQVGGDDGENIFDADAVLVDSGTTIEWVWESGNHNIVPTEMPDECGWEGVEDRYEPPYDHEWTFDVPGRYGYVCTPHEDDGMSGLIFVLEDRTDENVVEVQVGGEDGENIFEPEMLKVDPGTTIHWDWESGNHNLVPETLPVRSDWDGVEDRYEPEYDHLHTFVHPGVYEFVCTPHVGDGMVGSVYVTNDYDVVDYTGEDEVEIQVGGEDGENIFDADAVLIDKGTTVEWVWESGNHDIVPTEMPDECGWEGVDERQEPPYDHEWTFQVPGRYGYVCSPHEDQGMTGMLFVLEDQTGQDEATIEVGGEDGENIFEPEFVHVDEGTTVEWVWESGNHDIVPTEMPDECGWEGVDERQEPPYDHEWTFQVVGEYKYICSPHEDQGMVGTLLVSEVEDEDDEVPDDEDDDEVPDDDGDDELPDDEDDGEDADDDGPGFGVGGAVAGIGGVAYVLKRRLSGKQTE